MHTKTESRTPKIESRRKWNHAHQNRILQKMEYWISGCNFWVHFAKCFWITFILSSCTLRLEVMQHYWLHLYDHRKCCTWAGRLCKVHLEMLQHSREMVHASWTLLRMGLKLLQGTWEILEIFMEFYK